MMHPFNGLQNGQKQVDYVVELEYPDESDLATPTKDVIIGNFSLPAGIIELFIGRKFHQVIVERNEQFLANKVLQVLRFRLDLVMFELAGFREDLDFLVEDDIANVVLADLADLDQSHHDFQLTQGAALLLQLPDQRLK